MVLGTIYKHLHFRLNQAWMASRDSERRGLFEMSVKLLIFQRFAKKREFQARLSTSTEKKTSADIEYH